ncbi:hypothetical protein TcWFU_009715 [Taenia crassiceps]|uniref:Fibronectin type-III domain-containing protein n=1 Tax=Taenia crassiceps TaxID=6207 RepID=A0ABR4Q943_9CEST
MQRGLVLGELLNDWVLHEGEAKADPDFIEADTPRLSSERIFAPLERLTSMAPLRLSYLHLLRIQYQVAPASSSCLVFCQRPLICPAPSRLISISYSYTYSLKSEEVASCWRPTILGGRIKWGSTDTDDQISSSILDESVVYASIWEEESAKTFSIHPPELELVDRREPKGGKMNSMAHRSSHSGIYGYATADVSAGGVTIDELEPHTLYDVTVQATGEGVNIVYPIGSIKTRSEATRKSMFEATYTEDIEILDILIHEPEGDEEDFDGYEVLRKTGGLDSQHAWQSVANLTADEREYEMEGVEPLTKYAVKVRGLVLPDSFIEMDDPLVFETMDADVSVPRDVKLQRNAEIILVTLRIIHTTCESRRIQLNTRSHHSRAIALISSNYFDYEKDLLRHLVCNICLDFCNRWHN